MQKGILIKGANLVDFLLDAEAGTTLWSGNENIQDLALFDNFKWYYVTNKEKQFHIVEVDFATTRDEIEEYFSKSKDSSLL
jgi:HKD family nuclease